MSATRRQQIAWAFYDWGNSAFATTVMAGLFPIFYMQYWHGDATAEQSTFEVGAFNTTAGVLMALMAPVIGAIADHASAKKWFLAAFAALGIVATAGLAAVGSGQWATAGLLFGIGVIGFQGSIVFYDALLLEVAGPEEVDWVSALGYAFGYLGGGLLFAVNVAMTMKPGMFGLADQSQAIKLSFVSVAVWWAVFTIPVLRLRERRTVAPARGADAVRQGLRQLKETFQQIRSLRPVFLFLAGYIIYIDGVGTVIRMATAFGKSLGFSTESLITALLIVQFVGFPAALAFGAVGQKLGARKGILIGLAVYLLATGLGSQMTSELHFYILAVTIGLVQGGVQSLSRSFFARLIPADKAGEFFGFYNMVGKFATLIGPLLMGGVSLATGSTRWGILSLGILFIVGGFILMKVPDPASRGAEAKAG